MSALRCCTQGSGVVRAGTIRSALRVSRIITRAAETKEDAASTSGTTADDEAASKSSFTREFTSFGARIVESDGKLSGPEDEKDFWEGDNMETLGRVMERFFLPGLVVLGLVCGGIAARTYNEDADVFIAPPSGPDSGVLIIPAGALAPAAADSPAVFAQPTSQ